MRYSIETVRRLAASYGSPLYVFNEAEFLKNYEHFEGCFRCLYDYYRISYSFKTNYAPYICRLVKQQGGLAEVVSDMELEIAQSIGYENSQIVYNGPCKGLHAIEHLKKGGILNVDNFEELDNILNIAGSDRSASYKIGIRVNIDIGQSFISRFGIDECDLDKAFALVSKYSNVKIIGIHCHIGRSRGLTAWENRIQSMLRLADRYFKDPPEYISLGSGMFGVMDPELAVQFSDNIPTFEQYAETVAGAMAEHYKHAEKHPVLFTEPGTTLVNKYIDFIAKVTAVKHIKGRTFIVINGSKHNIGEICELKRLPIQVIRSGNPQENVKDADFVGYTCLEHDVPYRGYTGAIAVGDYVVFGNVGGYSNVSKPPFISPNCAMISSTGAVIKRRESVREVMCTYE